MQKASFNSFYPRVFYQKLSKSPYSLAEKLKGTNFCLEETAGRPWKLFLSPHNTAIATCVSCDFQMDKGIARQFAKKYGYFDELIEKGLEFPDAHEVGKIGVLKTRDRFVYYLLSRRKWWDSGSYKAMEECLVAMQMHCVKNDIQRIAIPRLGAQCDCLDWDEVKSLIYKAFQHSNVHITAYSHR
ncbi:ADP-ribose glycohydrolase OARD1-like isoform X2 [Xenia sp. Carnegie-2017]|uniref:ADP-ribose glycohydrolase OARD1-like isoform X2 n=1 Tax=Xenia sp. Carnegie-2017 TaxID=2897299 RepID=UPI001F035C66|nr:ADP-ribose glycohydrolase OARD1-like isoform X2 [Xenia sp. Carnegie-2017]